MSGYVTGVYQRYVTISIMPFSIKSLFGLVSDAVQLSDMCAEMCADMCGDMCVDIREKIRIDTCRHLCIHLSDEVAL